MYNSSVDVEALMVGRVYNLASSVASALMLDGYAELYEALSADEKRERAGEAAHIIWTAADHAQRWAISRRTAPRKKGGKKR